MNKKIVGYLSFSLLLFASHYAFASEVKCSDVVAPDIGVKDIANRQSDLDKLKSEFFLIQPTLSGQSNTKWASYNWIVQVKKIIKEQGLKAEDFSSLKPAIENAAKSFEADPNKNKFVDFNYRFFEQLESANQLLDKPIFPNIYLAHAADDTVLIKQAVETVKRNEELLRKLYPKSGYGKTMEIVDALEKHSEQGRRLLDLVNDELMVTIRRPESGRFWIPIAGFQNQRVTGTTGGLLSTERRNRAESSLTRQDTEFYSKQSYRYMPQYGEARPNLNVKDMEFRSDAYLYGADIWIIKQKVIEERGTWTPIDSLSQPGNYGRISDDKVNWNEMFLPWSHRELMVPYLLRNAKYNLFYPKEVDDFPIRNSGYGGCYMETQIWGPLTIEHVEGFAFTSTIPTKEFLNELRSRGIKIYDARTGKFIPYVEAP